MKIGEVVRLTGIPASAIRYDETQGIIQAIGVIPRAK
ncbi:MerR family DNA-binding transcriptional regulator [Tatumella sp. UBA2305]|nr:MerR family DNA-binding transcriptional regulator [Tatumella sp. UBA2305]